MYTNADLTQEDRLILEWRRRRMLDEMGSYGSQMVVPSETETDKFKPFAF